MGCMMNCLFYLMLATGSVEGVFTSSLLLGGDNTRWSWPSLGRMRFHFLESFSVRSETCDLQKFTFFGITTSISWDAVRGPSTVGLIFLTSFFFILFFLLNGSDLSL